MQFRNGVFIITEECRCPLYNMGEELQVCEGILTLPVAKPTCLVLARDLIIIASEDTTYERFRLGENLKTRFECGGCSGVIRFEFKKEKDFTTLQMKLLAASERREKLKNVGDFAALLRAIDLFEPLTDDDLFDLAALLKLEEYPWAFPIVQKGDSETQLYIIVSGMVDVVDDEGVTLSQMKRGDVFGEMSLMSGEPVTTTIMAAEPCQLAVLKRKDFRHILTKYPALQVFFYKLLVNRLAKMNLQRAEELASGMVGQLADISVVELCQMINSNQKTGRLKLEYDASRAMIVFNEGEIVHAEINNLTGPDAYYEILSMSSGRFKFVHGVTEAEKKKDVIGGFMGMLMEGMRRLDDRRED